MRLIIMRDSMLRIVGFGLQWGKPLNLEFTNWRRRRLGLLLNYAAAAEGRALAQGAGWAADEQQIRAATGGSAASVAAAVARTYTQICQRCGQPEGNCDD